MEFFMRPACLLLATTENDFQNVKSITNDGIYQNPSLFLEHLQLYISYIVTMTKMYWLNCIYYGSGQKSQLPIPLWHVIHQMHFYILRNKEKVSWTKETLDSNSKLKIEILMKFSLLVSMRIKIGFAQGFLMNDMNWQDCLQMLWQEFFQRPWWWSYSNLEDAMFALPMAAYYHKLMSVVIWDTKNGNATKFIKNSLL